MLIFCILLPVLEVPAVAMVSKYQGISDMLASRVMQQDLADERGSTGKVRTQLSIIKQICKFMLKGRNM